MNKTNKILIIIIIFLLLILAGSMYIFLGTDLLKSNKQLFFEYLGQVTNQENGFLDNDIKNYNKKKNEQVYKNSGEFNVDIEIAGEDLGEGLEKVEEIRKSVDDLSISFNGKSDKANKLVEENIEIDYGNDVIFPINYKQNGDVFGLQTDFVDSKYIAIENNNLKELAQKFGMTELASIIPNKISFEEIKKLAETEKMQKIDLSAEEEEQLKQMYKNILNEQLVEEYFSSSKDGNAKYYTLSLTGQQIKSIIIKMLEATIQNDLTKDIIKEYLQKNNLENVNDIEKKWLDNFTQHINEISIPNIRITVKQVNKELEQIIFENDEVELSIKKAVTNEKLEYQINLKINSSDIARNLIAGSNGKAEVELNINCTYSGLQEMNNVEENYNISLNLTKEDNALNYKYSISNTVQFVDGIEMQELNNENVIILNEYEKTTELINDITQKLEGVNQKQMKELGLDEDKNPLLLLELNTFNMHIYSIASKVMADKYVDEYFNNYQTP